MQSTLTTIPSIEQRQLKIGRSATFLPDVDVLLASNDVLDFLATVPDESVNLVVSSPPYNIGKSYERRTPLLDYLRWQGRVLKECKRVLKPDGSLCWQVGNYVESGEVFPLDAYFYRILKASLGFRLRNRIIWRFEHGLHASKRFSGRYEVILWFTKADNYVFNLDSVRVPQKYPGKRHYKGPNIGELSGNPLGKNPSDIWMLLESEWDSEIWDIPNVKWNHPEKTEHPAQYPIELIERLVLALTNPGDTVLDPFCGVGSALVASAIQERRAIGVDSSPEYIEIAHERLNAFLDGSLKRRTIGTPKHTPSGREKVSQRPLEWPGS
jgi:adenine-specific DNA-methyltransferase